MKPGARQYATGVWAQRRGFSQPSDAAAAREGAFDCDRKGCLPVGPARPALAASCTRREPSADRWAAMCAAADIVILRSDTAPPGPCRAPVILKRGDFARLGAAEVFRRDGHWDLSWSQPIRGRRPWSADAQDPTGSAE